MYLALEINTFTRGNVFYKLSPESYNLNLFMIVVLKENHSVNSFSLPVCKIFFQKWKIQLFNLNLLNLYAWFNVRAICTKHFSCAGKSI